MKTLSYTKDVVASRLTAELEAAGVAATWLEGGLTRNLVVAPVGDTTVSVFVADSQDATVVAAVVAAHDATLGVAAAAQALVNQQTILQRAAAALVANDTYLAIASPTTAQAVAQVKTLTRECNGLIRILLQTLSDVSDT